MEDWQTVAVETELQIESDAAASEPGKWSKGCGCLSSLLFVIIGIRLLRLLVLTVAFLTRSE
ncbi:MAG TPA: hypothetical protein VF648_09740 [Pyrinomonadaceae bacterium]|jgi:hypothetical protein